MLGVEIWHEGNVSMSTHGLALHRHRNTWRPLFLVCCGLLLALQLGVISSSVAFASASPVVTPTDTSTPTGTPTAIPTAPASAPPDEGFAKASVSVVRLLAAYTPGADVPGHAPINCTGLGVLVSSVPVGTGTDTTVNDWILTDGSLVDPSMCDSAHPTVAGLSITVYLDTAYSDKPVVEFTTTNPHVVCLAPPASCGTGPALIGFQGDILPFVPLPTTNPANQKLTTSSQAIALLQDSTTATTVSASMLPNPNPTSQVAQTYLTPQSVGDVGPLEPGNSCH